MNLLNEKIDYSKDPEAPISLGMKILKKIEKEWGKDADIYDAIESIIISADVKYPKQMAMCLKRTLENYDMWEVPYKGLVNKIQKWQFVNENFNINILNESESTIDDYDRVYGIIDQLVYKYKEWSLKDIQDQLDNGDIWFEDVMREMNIDMNDLSDDEDAELCDIIINAMQNYLDDKDYFGQLHENSYQSDFADKFAYDKYYRPMDIKELMQEQKSRQLSKFEYWVLEAAMWARSRNKNYLGYSKEIPAVEYKNGKFYAQTIHDGMTEVPFNYNVMTPEWLFKK